MRVICLVLIISLSFVSSDWVKPMGYDNVATGDHLGGAFRSPVSIPAGLVSSLRVVDPGVDVKTNPVMEDEVQERLARMKDSSDDLDSNPFADADYSYAANDAVEGNTPDVKPENVILIREGAKNAYGEINAPPTVTQIDPIQVDMGTDYVKFQVAAYDQRGDKLTYSLDSNSILHSMHINEDTGSFSWNTALVNPGVYNVMVTVTDDGEPTMSQGMLVSIEVGKPITCLTHSDCNAGRICYDCASCIKRTLSKQYGANTLLLNCGICSMSYASGICGPKTHQESEIQELASLDVKTLLERRREAERELGIHRKHGLQHAHHGHGASINSHEQNDVERKDQLDLAKVEKGLEKLEVHHAHADHHHFNSPPELQEFDQVNLTQTTSAALELKVQAFANDPDAEDVLTYSLDANSLVFGMTIDARTGMFHWDPSSVNPGTYLVLVTVMDDAVPIGMDSKFLTIQVEGPSVCAEHYQCGEDQYCFSCKSCLRMSIETAGAEALFFDCGKCATGTPTRPILGNCGQIESCWADNDGVDGRCPVLGHDSYTEREESQRLVGGLRGRLKSGEAAEQVRRRYERRKQLNVTFYDVW